MDEFLKVAQPYGFFAVTLAVFVGAAWRSSVWFGANILIPIKDRHIVFIDNLDKSVKRQEEALTSLAIMLRSVLDTYGSLKAEIERRDREWADRWRGRDESERRWRDHKEE